MPRNSTVSFRTVERKLYPTAEQEKILDAYLVECCRVYNRGLAHKIKSYQRRKKTPSLYDQYGLLAQQRRRIPSLKDMPSEFARAALRRVDTGFKSFFRRVKAGAKKKGFPRFKAKNQYRSMEHQRPMDYFREGVVHVPGAWRIKSRGPNVVGIQKLIRVIKRADAWYAQVVVEGPADPAVRCAKTKIGIDVGISTFASLSDGTRVEHPRVSRKSEKKLRGASRNLSRKRKGSANRRKAVKKLGKVYRLTASRRKNFAHQTANDIVSRADLIGFEKLDIANMIKGKFAKSILDAAWGLFLYFLTYKAASAGKLAVAVPAAGTSQECPQCGKVKKKSLSERTHACECGLVLDRDLASALVVEARAVAVATALGLWREGPLLVDTSQPASPPDEAGSPNPTLSG